MLSSVHIIENPERKEKRKNDKTEKGKSRILFLFTFVSCENQCFDISRNRVPRPKLPYCHLAIFYVPINNPGVIIRCKLYLRPYNRTAMQHHIITSRLHRFVKE